MTQSLASIPKWRKIYHMSNPELVRTIRKLSKEQTIHKLKHGTAPASEPLLLAAIQEAKRRHITINHPELKTL